MILFLILLSHDFFVVCVCCVCYIGCFLKRFSTNEKRKCNKKWRWPSRKMKIWYKYIQQQCSVYICIEIFFESWFFWLIWPLECLILMILTMTKYPENWLRDSTLSFLSIVECFSPLEMILKIPNESFLRITRYNVFFCQYDGNYVYNRSRINMEAIMLIKRQSSQFDGNHDNVKAMMLIQWRRGIFIQITLS